MDLQPNKTDAIIKPITNTRISASEWNQLVGSCMEFITQAGLTPDAADNEQFLNAFKIIAANLELIGANTNLSNVTNTGKGNAMKWLSLDTTAKVSVLDATSQSSGTYTPTAPGVIYVYNPGTSSEAKLEVNNVIIQKKNSTSGTYGFSSNAPVEAGDTVAYTNVQQVFFFPYKG